MNKKLLYSLAFALSLSVSACDTTDESIPGWPWLDNVVNVVEGGNTTQASYDKTTKNYTFTVGTEAAPVSEFSISSIKYDDKNNVVPMYLNVANNAVIDETDVNFELVEAGSATNIKFGWESVWTVTVNLKNKTISATCTTRPDANKDIVELGWTNVSADYGELPSYINIYKAPSTLEGQAANAYIAISNTAKGGSWNVLGDLYHCDDPNIDNEGVDEAFTPAGFYANDAAPVIINGGLFFWAEKSDGTGFYISQNLVYRDGQKLAVNQTYYSEDWVTLWYPTIGAFYEKEDGTFGTTWTYYAWPGTNYCYPQPADNSMDKDPLDPPGADFPAGATEFAAKTAIGGVGVLINNGKVVNTWKQEMLNVGADSRQPRTAIGITADKRLVFFVCEGRNAEAGISGLTTGEVANVLKSLGCVDALNLDGGGSSCMLVNGKETIKPSDGGQRAVATALKMY